MINLQKKPSTPGEILKEQFLKPLAITQNQLAEHISCDVTIIDRIIQNKSSVTPVLAIKLSDTFITTPEFWLNAQQAVDIFRARTELKERPVPLVRVI